MDVGRLNKRIEIYRYTRFPDGTGGWFNSKSLYKTIWCKIKQTESKVNQESANLSNELYLTLTVRKRTGDVLQVNDVFELKGKTYRINSIKEVVLDYWTEIKCTTIE